MRIERAIGWTCAALAGLATTVSVERASAQEMQADVDQGSFVYVEDERGTLTLYQRVDLPGEGDGTAQLRRVDDVTSERMGPMAIGVVRVSDVSVPTDAPASEMAPTPAPRISEPGELAAETAPWVRPRIGISVLGGKTFEDPEGWLLGGSLRLGAQLGDVFAVYYQPTAMYAALHTGLASTYDDAFTMWNSLLVEATLFDFLSIGAGPSVDFYLECNPAIQANAGCAREEAAFGLHGRVALNLGAMPIYPGQRGALNLTFETHPTWFGDDLMTIAFLGGVGYDLF